MSNSIHLQYCAKEMQTKFAEISEITRISAIKLRTFASDESGEISVLLLLIDKFTKISQIGISPFYYDSTMVSMQMGINIQNIWRS